MTNQNDNSDWLRDAFSDVQSELTHKVHRAARSIKHAPTQGATNEKHWVELFCNYLPTRYRVKSGIVVDSLGQRSDAIDLVVFDGHFTPTLLDQQNHQYIPAEAVYAVFEVKPTIHRKHLKYAGEKAASVRRLTQHIDRHHPCGGSLQVAPSVSDFGRNPCGRL